MQFLLETFLSRYVYLSLLRAFVGPPSSFVANDPCYVGLCCHVLLASCCRRDPSCSCVGWRRRDTRVTSIMGCVHHATGPINSPFYTYKASLFHSDTLAFHSQRRCRDGLLLLITLWKVMRLSPTRPVRSAGCGCPSRSRLAFMHIGSIVKSPTSKIPHSPSSRRRPGRSSSHICARMHLLRACPESCAPPRAVLLVHALGSFGLASIRAL